MLRSSRADVLRWTLLGALGASLTFSCGGTAETSDDGDGTPGDGDVTVGDGDVTVGDGDGTVGDGDVTTGDGDGTGSGGNGTGGGGNGTGGGGNGIPACTNPVDLSGGFQSCDEGYTHRGEPSACDAFVPRTEQIGDPAACAAPDGSCCVFDADCTGANQYCQANTGLVGGLPGAWCATGCQSDADCGADMICQCGDPMGLCVTAVCAADSDCAGEARCASFAIDDGCGPWTQFTCQTAADECATDADCAEGLRCDGTGGVRQCVLQQVTCAVGRPFLVADSIRVAPLCERLDWAESVAPSRLDMSPATRVLLSEAWEEVAQMEHASVAAFARFSLQLLSLGAPAELIERTNQALVDETLHARLSFGLASAYRGRPVGPAPLDISGALADSSLEGIVATTIIEGCVGETAAALEAAEAALLCEDLVVRRVLEQIADDESRHAELAWRFLSFVLREHPELTDFARSQFSLLLAESEPAQASGALPASPLEAYGVLSQARRMNIRRSALTEVVGPCAAQLFAARPTVLRPLKGVAGPHA